ncbi:PAS domain-containing protein [Palleronia sediminis]|nr:PAS domain-containing protein [Palleronia sediminis]
MRDSDTRSVQLAPRIPGVGRYRWTVSPERLEWCDGTLAIYGVRTAPRDEAEFLAFVHPDDRVAVEARISHILESGASFDHGFRILRPDGTLRHVQDRGVIERDAEGRAVVVHGMTFDVTEQMAIRDGAQAAQAMADLIERCPFGVFTTDADLRITHVSRGGIEAFGEIRPVIGRDIGDILHIAWPRAFAEQVIGRLRDTLQTGRPFHASGRAEPRLDRGTVESYDWQVERIVMPDGQPGLICHFYDLTVQNARETALREGEERLRMAAAVAGIGTWDSDLVSGKSVWSEEIYDLMGLPRDDRASADRFFDFVTEADRPRIRDAFVRAIETRAPFEEEFHIRRPSGEIRCIAGYGRVVREEAGQPTRMIGVNFDVTEARRAKDVLRDSETRLRMLLDNTVAFIAVLDLDGRFLEVNRAALDLAGVEREDVIGLRMWESPWLAHMSASRKADLRRGVRTLVPGKVHRGDTELRGRDGATIQVAYMMSPVVSKAGKLERIVLSGMDITDRKTAEEHVHLLLREMSHRTKNAYALVQAIARRIHRSDPDNFFDSFAERLAALAASHDLVHAVAGPKDADIAEIARSQLAPFDMAGGRLEISGPPLRLTPDAAQALGMALHELGTNAIKHGALSVPDGRVTLDWDTEGGRLRVTWIERGGPPVTRPARNGFGTMVLGALISQSLGARAETAWPEEGLEWRFEAAPGDVSAP